MVFGVEGCLLLAEKVDHVLDVGGVRHLEELGGGGGGGGGEEREISNNVTYIRG